MSKNNSQEIMRKMAKQHQRFGLRKLSVGVASVLLGTTFIFGSGLVAHADETTAVVDNTAETQQTSTSVASSSDQDGASAASSQSSSTANVAQSEATPAVNVQNNKKTNNAAVNDGAKNVTTPSSAAINSKVKEDQLTGNKQQAAPVVLSEEPTESSAPASDKQTPQVKIPFKVQYELFKMELIGLLRRNLPSILIQMVIAIGWFQTMLIPSLGNLRITLLRNIIVKATLMMTPALIR